MSATLLDIQEINSKDNQYIKLAKQLHSKRSRYQEGLFLLEGKTLVKEALKQKLNIKYIFLRDKNVINDLVRQPATQVFLINEELMSKIATTESPPPIVAIAEMPVFEDIGIDYENSKTTSSMFLYCENISDPGNLGSIIRTAFAAGVKTIYLSPGSVDIYNTKVLRSSMGAAFFGPAVYISLEDLVGRMKRIADLNSTSLEVLGTSPHAELNYHEVQFGPLKNILLVVGNETRGLSEASQKLCTQLVKIPLDNNIESINILAATSIVLFNLMHR